MTDQTPEPSVAAATSPTPDNIGQHVEPNNQSTEPREPQRAEPDQPSQDGRTRREERDKTQRDLVKQGKLRRRMSLWERSRIIVIMVLWVAVAAAVAKSENSAMPLRDAVSETAASYSWMRYVIVAEIIRQLLIYLREVSVGHNSFWTSVAGKLADARGQFSEPVRFMAGRAVNFSLAYLAVGWLISRQTGAPIITALPMLAQRLADGDTIRTIFFYTLYSSLSVIMLFAMTGGKVELIKPEEIKTGFGDVWGQDAVVERVRETVTYLEKPELIERNGGYVPGGILLWGPPGTGKTLMAEAMAGETGRPFVLVDPAAFKASFIGVAPLKMRLLFRKLRRLSQRYGGVVAFFDEADELGNRGGSVSRHEPGDLGRWLSPAGVELLMNKQPSAADRQEPRRGLRGVIVGGGGDFSGVLQAMLAQMSGLKKPRKGMWRLLRRWLNMAPAPTPNYRILIVMATNRPDSLDPALMRPGRLDRHFRVGYPTKEGRQNTFEGYLAKVPHQLSDYQIEQLAASTPHATGAVIKDIVNEALIGAIRQGHGTITWADITKAKRDKTWGLPLGVEYSDRRRHAVAIHEAAHALTTYRLWPSKQIEVATIDQTQEFYGAVGFRDSEEEDTAINWASDFDADIAVSLASLAGERYFYGGDSASGVGGDVRGATTVAYMMEGMYAMGASLANRSVLGDFGVGNSDTPDRSLVDAVEARLAQGYDAAAAVIAAESDLVLALAHALETHKTLLGEDVLAVFENRQGEMVDGTIYHNDQARAALRNYHEAMLALHRRQIAAAPPLPELGAGMIGTGGMVAGPTLAP